MDTLLFELSDCSQVIIRGEDRKSFLHSFSTNDVNKLVDGEVCEAFIPDIKGKILGHVFVVNEPEQLRLISLTQIKETVTPHLQKYLLGVEASVEEVTSATSVLCLVGENSTQALGFKEDLNFNQSIGVDVNGEAVGCARVDITLPPCYLVYGSIEKIDSVKQKLISSEIQIAELSQFEQLRIEGGFPLVGVDVSDANIAQESARTERTISFTKGCYLGQEPIARLDAMGHTNKELRGLLIEAENVEVGASVLAEEKEVGTLTSVAKHNEGTCVALAILRVKHAEPGNQLAVTDTTGTYPAKVFWPTLS